MKQGFSKDGKARRPHRQPAPPATHDTIPEQNEVTNKRSMG